MFNNFKHVAPRAVALLLASVSANAVAAQEAIIISDGGSDATSAANGLKARLEVAGYNVNIQTTLDTLNADPTAIAQVWDVRITKALTAGEKTDYLSYLNNAGGLFLLGEHSGFAIRNDSLLDFILSAGGGAVTMTPSIVQTQYVTESFNGSGLIVPAVALPITVPAAGTFSAAGNGTFITTTEPNGTGNGTGVAFGAGSLTNAPTGRLLSYLDVNTFQAAHYNSNLALRAIVDRMIGFVAGNFQVDPDLPPVGGGGGGGPAVIDGSQPSYDLGDPAATGSTIDFDGGTLDLTGGADPTNLVTADISITDNGAFVNTSGNSGTFAGTITGTGGLIVSGQGTLALTGTNAYAGGTVITDDATLSIDNAQALGTGGVALMDGRLHFDMDGTVNAPVTMMAGVNILDTGANDVTMDGNITGTGGFIVSGQGTLSLTGTNTYAGGTIITDDSTLAINSAQALGTGGVTMMQGRLLFGAGGAVDAPLTLMAGVNTLDTFGHNVTLDGAITGTGGFLLSGQGTLTLTGTNSHAGGTLVTDNSTLTINNAQALGTGGVTLADGRLRFDMNGAVNAPVTLMAGVNTLDTFGHNVTLGGAITGAGPVIVSGQGTLALTGTNTHAGGILVTDDSTLSINNAQALGTGGVGLANGRLRFDMDGAVDAPVTLMAGVNTLDTGVHNVTIGGSITGTGGFIKTGSARLNLTGDSDYSGATVVSDGRLAVNGSILNSGFIVESGASIGGNGDLGGLIVRTNATAAPGNSIGQLRVATTVLFEQGSVYEVEVDASGASDRIEATGVATLEGGTVRVLAEAGNYRPQTSYQILTAAGGVVGEFEDVSSNLAFLLPTLSYGTNAVMLTLTRNDVRFVDVADTTNQRATAGAIGGSFGAETPVYYELVGQSAEAARAAFDSLSGEIHSSTLTVAAQQTDEIRRALLNRMTLPAGEGTTLWTDVNRNWNQFDGNRNAAEVSNDAYGFQVGVESQMGDVRVGVSGGYRSGDASLGARRSEADLEEVSGAVYARGDVGAFALRLGATYSNYDFRTRRTAQAGDISQELTATYGGRAIQTFGEVGRAVPLGIGKVEPFVGLNAMWLKNDAFTETGGSLALTSENKERRRAWSTLGLKASVPLIVGSPVNFGAKVGWQRALTRSTVESDLAFVAGGPDFSVEGVPLARDAAVVDAGVHWMSEQGLGLSVTYNGSFANGQSHAARAVLSFNF